MSKAHDFITVSNSQTITVQNNLKRLLRFVCDDDCIITFKDGSHLVFKKGVSFRDDKLLIVLCDDELPFCPIDLKE